MMMKTFKIGIGAESLRPLGLSAFEALDWAIMNDADGVQFSGPGPEPLPDKDRSFLKELAEYAGENHLYLEWGGAEYLPPGPAAPCSADLPAVNRKAAETARALGLSLVLARSGGPARWSPEAPVPKDLVRAVAAGLRDQKPMLTDLGVVLALEPRSDLSTFDLAAILELTETRPGECFGVSFDTLAPLILLEDPPAAVERVLPWIVATRVRDGGIALSGDGFTAFAAEAGTGVIDLKAVFSRLSSLDRKVNLTLEDRGGDTLIPVFNPSFAAGFSDLSSRELLAVLRLATRTQEMLDEGGLAVLDRDGWSEKGERRLKRGIRALRRIVEEGGR